MADIQIDDVANDILGSLGDDDSPAETTESSVDTSKEENTLNESQVAQQIEDAIEEPAQTEEPAAPAIEPPVSWTAEAKDKFKALPPDLQEYWAKRESEREQGYSKTRQELADERKATETERETAKSERKAYAERLNAFVEVATKFNPKMAEWQNRDWAKYSAENPLEAPAEWFAYQQQLGAIAAANAERERVNQQSQAENRQKAHKVLSERLDFWKDTEKRSKAQNDVREYGKSIGYTDDEISALEDPRGFIMAHDAARYRALMAEQAKIAATKKIPAAGKVLKPQSTEGNTGNGRAEALDKIAARSGRTDDQAAAILARL